MFTLRIEPIAPPAASHPPTCYSPTSFPPAAPELEQSQCKICRFKTSLSTIFLYQKSNPLNKSGMV